jgi:hypothetical protein
MISVLVVAIVFAVSVAFKFTSSPSVVEECMIVVASNVVVAGEAVD